MQLDILSAYHSHPSWMVKRWIARFGEEAAEAASYGK
jgi:16S rRNA C967 or C1407 C5-methylase (RsmB/RsmF family)